MQKRKLMVIMALMGITSPLYAAVTTDITPAEQVVTKNGAVGIESAALESPIQGHIIDLMEKDFSYETEQRSLSQQLSLEKLRSEIRKLRGEQNTSVKSMPDSMVTSNYDAVMDDSITQLVPPQLRVLLLSEIAGQKRVAVSSEGGAVKMVILNQYFTYNGHRYIARRTHGDIIAVEGIKK